MGRGDVAGLRCSTFTEFGMVHSNSLIRPASAARAVMMLGSALVMMGMFACAPSEQSTWERVQQTRIIRVGYALEPPFAYLDSSGRLTGESPEILRHVMSELGVDSIEWVAAPFRSLIMELQQGDYDIVAAGMYRTPERALAVAFSHPTMRDPTGLLVRREDSLRVTSLDDFVRDRRLRLAIIGGAAEERLALAAGLSSTQLRDVPGPNTGRAAVLAKHADAFALSVISLSRLLASRSDSADLAVRALDFPHDSELADMALGQPAFAFRRDDVALRRAVDAVLTDFLDSPAHHALLQRFQLDGLGLTAPADGRSSSFSGAH
jgi:polar amino acid transport system substrate-binding protein